MPAHQVEGRLGGPLDRGHRDLVVRARACTWSLDVFSCVMRRILMIHEVSLVLTRWKKTYDARGCVVHCANGASLRRVMDCVWDAYAETVQELP